jgi:sarcosine oxidase, subunit gamma
VIAEAARRSALAGYHDRLDARAAASRGTLTIREVPFLTQVNLRTNPSAADSMAAFQRELGFALPIEPNRVMSHGDRWGLWLGPDEWLVVAPPDQRQAITAALRSAVGAQDGSVVDVSANRTVIELSGSAATELLAHGCALDLHPRAFGPGRCAQTMLAKAQVIVQQTAATPAFYIYVRASFAGYLADWLLDATTGD